MLLHHPIQSGSCHDLQAGPQRGRAETEVLCLSSEDDTQFPLPSYAMILSESGEGAGQDISPSNAKKRAETFFHGHLSAFVCILNSQSHWFLWGHRSWQRISPSSVYVQLQGSHRHMTRSTGTVCIHIYAHMYRHTLMHIHTVCFIYSCIK